MLKRLSVENYALIDRLDLELGDGLNIITGETGAGKSILLGALGLLLGNRGDGSTLKDSEKSCVIEGTFDIGNYALEAFFEENDLDYESVSIVRRVITAAGKSRAFINELPVQLTTLREFGLRLIDIHSQHQSLMLSDDAFRTNILDSIAAHVDLLAEYRASFDTLRTSERKLAALKSEADQNSKDEEYLRFQSEQLTQTALRDGEQEELEAELAELSHAEQIKEALGVSDVLLESDETGILSQLKAVEISLHRIKDVYVRSDEFADRVRGTLLELKDLQRELSSEAERIESDPLRMEFVEQRLNTIYALQQKHKVTSVAELIALCEDYTRRLMLISSNADEMEKLQADIIRQREVARKLAAKISQNRRKSAESVKKHIESTLAELGMPNSVISIEITHGEELRASGADTVKFLFSSNKGMTLQPIEKIASGGEVSRVMLCIKSLVARSSKLPTIIFDEIDTGVSGRIADAMGDIISELAGSMQVINITHLPQVASKGDNHYFVYKDETNAKSTTNIKKLSPTERVEEIAKMLSGTTVTDAAIAQANLLLNK